MFTHDLPVWSRVVLQLFARLEVMWELEVLTVVG